MYRKLMIVMIMGIVAAFVSIFVEHLSTQRASIINIPIVTKTPQRNFPWQRHNAITNAERQVTNPVSPKAYPLVRQTIWGMCYNRHLDIGDKGLTKLAGIVAKFLAEKEYIELAILHVSRADNGGIMVDIPPYIEKGTLLRNAFYEQIKRAFPNQQSEEIAARLGADLDIYFRGFGTMGQTVLLTPVLGSPGTYAIDWEADAVPGVTPGGIPDHHPVTSISGAGVLDSSDNLPSSPFQAEYVIANAVFSHR